MAENTTTTDGACNCTAGNFSTNCQAIIFDYQCRNCGFIFVPKGESTEIVCPKCTSNAVGQISRPVYIYPQWVPYYPPYYTYTYPSYPPYYVTYTNGTVPFTNTGIYSTTGGLNITGNCEIKST